MNRKSFFFTFQNLVFNLLVLFLLTACHMAKPSPCSPRFGFGLKHSPPCICSLIPEPAEVSIGHDTLILDPQTCIVIDSADREIVDVADYTARILAQTSPIKPAVVQISSAPRCANIYLSIVDLGPALGKEGYVLEVNVDHIRLQANSPEGLFRGVQTLRQLLPAVPGSPGRMIPVNTGTVTDYPRFSWRGAMLDVARHFFTVAEVKHYIDLMAYYKLNRLHLHLADDQGWRLQIHSWPNLTTHGGSTAVDGDPGGYYSQTDYQEIITYAARRYITVIPEFDMPGHTNAALSSYPELNCDGAAPPLYTGIEVGFSSLCISKELTFEFVDDVIGEVAQLTPGPYIHIGGDEASATSDEDYVYFIERVQDIVNSHDKQMIGWEEIAQARLKATSIAQHWNSDLAQTAVKQGAKIIMSPASRAYLDMKYSSITELGQDWAGLIDVRKAYSWDPAGHVEGVSEEQILGIEAPLWTETMRTVADLEYMALPRLPGYAELGWSPRKKRNWANYRSRLANHGLRWTAMGINFYPSPKVDWREQ